MGNQTIGAIFSFVINQGVISATFRQKIQRAITKQTIKVIIIFHLITDTQGVVIDMTYNADTKMYIDNKLAEISTAIVNNV